MNSDNFFDGNVDCGCSIAITDQFSHCTCKDQSHLACLLTAAALAGTLSTGADNAFNTAAATVAAENVGLFKLQGVHLLGRGA